MWFKLYLESRYPPHNQVNIKYSKMIRKNSSIYRNKNKKSKNELDFTFQLKTIKKMYNNCEKNMNPTCSFRVCDAVQENSHEPLEGVLIHGVDVGQVGHAEEQDLGSYCHRDVLRPGDVNVFLGLLSNGHFSLVPSKTS